MNGAKIELFDRRLDCLFSLRTPLLKALRAAGGTHTVGDVADMILRGAAQFFGDEKGACVTEVITYPRRRVLNVWLAFGELDACLGLIPEMEEFGRANGCTALVQSGREGWLPSLTARGWRKFGLMMAKEIV